MSQKVGSLNGYVILKWLLHSVTTAYTKLFYLIETRVETIVQIKEHTMYRVCDHDLTSMEPRYILNNFSNFDIVGSGRSHCTRAAFGSTHSYLISLFCFE